MRKVLFIILVFPLSLFAQQISNVKAQQNGDMVTINYDLIAATTTQTYFVDIFCSTDNGSTFPIRLASYTGALGKGVTPGAAKEVKWNVLADVNSINSNTAVFKVVAHPENERTNIVLKQGDVTMTITSVTNSGESLRFDFVMNTSVDKDVSLSLGRTKVYLYDGNVYSPDCSINKYGDYTGKLAFKSRFVPRGVPVTGYFTLNGIPSEITKIARVNFEIGSNDIVLKDLLIDKN